ncbi:MAG: hypothetical protein IPP94_08035 [Ignavibacteria bacterium]|nr:hypothetical protein [Ignavibacteria bacterium]
MKTSLLLCILLLGSAPLIAQDIESQLSGNSASEGFSIKKNDGSTVLTVRGNGRVGINQTTPQTALHVGGQIQITGGTPGAGQVLTSDASGLATWEATALSLDKAYDFGAAGGGRTITADAGPFQVDGTDGIISRGSLNNGTDLAISGGGVRMMWYPKKAAFRAGSALNTSWNLANIGNYSAAFGYGTVASGSASTAIGQSATASGDNAFAAGQVVTASGNAATAFGYGSEASGTYAVAMGRSATASGDYSIAMGYATTASGESSTAMGTYVSTGGRTGTLMIGDASTTTVYTAVSDNRFGARFSGGYYFYTNSGRSLGVYMGNSDGSWSTISDSTKKERFHTIDAEATLRSFATLRLGSWSYKGDGQRHYGPMAQDWFAAFGRDGVGVVGTDTSLATADVDGILCITIQALEKRTAELKSKTDEIALLQDRIARLEKQAAAFTALQARMAKLETLLAADDDEEDCPAGQSAVSLQKQASLITPR